MRSSKTNNGAACAGLTALMTLAACSEIGTEAPPGLDTEIQATIEGSITYIGPRPACRYDELGAPVSIPGVVVMTLIDDAKPLAPEGTNQTPASFLAIPGTRLFELADCRPSDPGAFDPADTLMRGVDFTWPQIDLAPESGQTVSYRVTGFYDQRGDFSPFFTVQSATTKGDVAGAAVKSQTDPRYELVTMGNVVDSPLGEVHPGVAVMLGGLVMTEPPMFRVVGGPLDAARPMPFQITGPTLQTELLATSSFTLRMFGRDLAGGDADDQDLERVLDLLRPDADPNEPRLIDPDLQDEVAYAWYHDQLDFNGNGIPDEHPVLGPIRQKTMGDEASEEIFRLETPVIYLQRVRTPEEVRAGIPDVAIQAAAPNRDHGTFPDLPAVEYPDTQVIVPPAATVLLNAASPICVVPYMPPGSPREYYEDRPESPSPVPIECTEVPTGAYGINVMHGLVGGTVVASADSETGFDIAGGSFASQLWAVPNALGDLEQIGDLLPPDQLNQGLGEVVSQSVDATLYFVDSTPDGPTGRQEDPQHCDTNAQTPFYDGIPIYKTGFPYENECESGEVALDDLCCEPIRHLCFVPRCAYDPCNSGIISSPREGTGEMREFSYTNRCGERVTDTAYVPECIPFQLPTVCCQGIWDEIGGMPAPLPTPDSCTQ